MEYDSRTPKIQEEDSVNEQELFIEAQSIIKVTETGHMRLGLICRQVEEQHLWTNHLDPETGQPCHSFARWLRILAPRAYSTCYQAIDDVRALADIPAEDLAQIPASNAKTLIKLSTKVRNEPATLKAAKTLRNAEFIEQIQRTHPDQCIERSKIKRFVLEESALDLVNRTLQMAFVRGAKNESDALEMMAAEAAESWRAEDEVLEAVTALMEDKTNGYLQ
jgi:uncharacterized protein YlzI (FlbEa/FlbD family)